MLNFLILLPSITKQKPAADFSAPAVFRKDCVTSQSPRPPTSTAGSVAIDMTPASDEPFNRKLVTIRVECTLIGERQLRLFDRVSKL